MDMEKLIRHKKNVSLPESHPQGRLDTLCSSRKEGECQIVATITSNTKQQAETT